MPHYCIKYRHTVQGTMPEYVYEEPYYIKDMYPVWDNTAAGGKSRIVIGISKDGDTGDAEVFQTKEELLAYLQTSQQEGFDALTAADLVWSQLDALNAA